MAVVFEKQHMAMLVAGLETSAQRFKSNIDTIIEKYNKPFPNDDLVNLSTMTIHTDRGSIRRIRYPLKFGASKQDSDKKKDKPYQRQVVQPKCPIDPDVSMAIVPPALQKKLLLNSQGQCTSYMKDLNAIEDEPSDAETISSNDDDDDEDSYESYLDDDDSDESYLDDDDNVSDEDDGEDSSRSDISDNDEVETAADSENGIKKHKQDLSDVRPNRIKDSDIYHQSNTSITSGIRDLSFLSPQRNTSSTSTKRSLNILSNNSGSHSIQKGLSYNEPFVLENQIPHYDTHQIPASNYSLRKASDNSPQRRNETTNYVSLLEDESLIRSLNGSLCSPFPHEDSNEADLSLRLRSSGRRTLNSTFMAHNKDDATPRKKFNDTFHQIENSLMRTKLDDTSKSTTVITSPRKSDRSISKRISILQRDEDHGKLSLSQESSNDKSANRSVSISQRVKYVSGDSLNAEPSSLKSLVSQQSMHSCSPLSKNTTRLSSSHRPSCSKKLDNVFQGNEFDNTSSKKLDKTPRRVKLNSTFQIKQKSSNTSEMVNVFQNGYENDAIPFLNIKSPIPKTVNKFELDKNKCQRGSSPVLDESCINKSAPKRMQDTFTKNDNFFVSYSSPQKSLASNKSPQNSNKIKTAFDKMTTTKESLARTSAKTKISTETKSVLDSVFKSPQGVRVKRIVPVNNEKMHNLSNLQSDTTISLDQQQNNRNLLTANISKHSNNNLNSSRTEYCAGLRLYTYSSGNKKATNCNIMQEISFTSTDTESQNGLPNCYVLLKSIEDQSTQESLTVNKQGVSPERKTVKDSPADITLTSPLRHLCIQPDTSNTHFRSPRLITHSSNSVSEKQNSLNTLLSCTHCSNGHVKCSVKIPDPVDTNMSPRVMLQNDSCKCCHNINTNCHQCGQKSVLSHGFDQKKWATPNLTCLSSHVLKPTCGQLKRKASDIYTNECFADASTSSPCVRSCVKTCLENRTNNSNDHQAETDKHVRDHSCVCQRHMQSSSQSERFRHSFYCQNDHFCAQSVSNCNDFVHTSSDLDNNHQPMGRKFAVAKKKLKSSFDSRQLTDYTGVDFSLHPIVDSQCHKHCTHQNNCQCLLPLPQQKNLRVCEWVEASRKESNRTASVQYSSVPPNLQQKYLVSYPHSGHHAYANSSHHAYANSSHHAYANSSHHAYANSSHHAYANSSHHAYANSSHHAYANSSHHSRITPRTEPQCNPGCQFSLQETSNHIIHSPQTLPCSHVVTAPYCGNCSYHSAIKQNQGADSQNKINTSGHTGSACCQHRISGSCCHLLKDGISSQVDFNIVNSLNKRANTSCKEIHTERSYMNLAKRDSTNIHHRPVSNSLSNGCHSDYFSEMESVRNQPATDGDTLIRDSVSIHHRHVPNSLSNSYHSDYCSEMDSVRNQPATDGDTFICKKQNSQILVPKIHSFLKHDLSNHLADDSSFRSFVEAHSPVLKAGLDISQSFPVASMITTTNNIMFPQNYIDQFSPLNPRRIDCVASEFKSAKKQVFSPMLKESYETSIPKRHCSKISVTDDSHNSADLFHRPCSHSSRSYFLHQDKPSSHRDTITQNTSSVNASSSKTFVEVNSHNRSQFEQTYRLSNLSPQKVDSDSKFKSRRTSLGLPSNRASTPVKAHLNKSAFSMEETISTIGVPDVSIADGDYSHDEGTIVTQDDESTIVSQDDIQNCSDLIENVDLL